MSNFKFSHLTCPLDQFEVRYLLSIEAPIFGNLHISLINVSLYLTVGLILFIAIVLNLLAADYDKVRSNFWKIIGTSTCLIIFRYILSLIPFRTWMAISIRLILFTVNSYDIYPSYHLNSLLPTHSDFGTILNPYDTTRLADRLLLHRNSTLSSTGLLLRDNPAMNHTYIYRTNNNLSYILHNVKVDNPGFFQRYTGATRVDDRLINAIRGLRKNYD